MKWSNYMQQETKDIKYKNF